MLAIPFRVIPPRWNEPEPSAGTDPAAYVLTNARAKAGSVGIRKPEALIIGVDTAVVLGNTVLGKPTGPAQVMEMMKMLSGRTHQVITGVSVLAVARQVTWSGTEISLVTFRRLNARELCNYSRLREPLDKAGAYAIQGYAGRFITDLSGSYFNIVGLPVMLLVKLLIRAGYNPG